MRPVRPRSTVRHAARIGLTTTLLSAGLVATASSSAADLANINDACTRVGDTTECPYDSRTEVGVFTVPAGVNSLTITLHGGDGGLGPGLGGDGAGAAGGAGGTATLQLGPAELAEAPVLAVYLGGDGEPGTCANHPAGGGAGGVTASQDPDDPGAPHGGNGGSGSPVRCGGGGGGAPSFVMDGTETLPNAGTPLLAAGGGGGGGGGGILIGEPEDVAVSQAGPLPSPFPTPAPGGVGGKGGPGAANGQPEDLGGFSGEDPDSAGLGQNGGQPQELGNGGLGDETPSGATSDADGGGGGGGGGYLVGGGGGGNGGGGGGGCGYPLSPDSTDVCEAAEVTTDSARPAGGPSGAEFGAAAVSPGVLFVYPTPSPPPPLGSPPPPSADSPGGGGLGSNDPNPNTNPESYQRIARSIGPNTVTAVCRAGGSCTVEPPAGPDSGFAVTGADGDHQAILFATLNGTYRPASYEAGKPPEGRPDCPGYRERNSDWVQFGFVDADDGASWRKTAVMTQRQKMKKAAAATLARDLQICFAAPYAFPTRDGYRLGTNGPDRVGVLPDCPSTNRVRTAVGRPSPCVSGREVVAVKGGWVVRFTFKVPASDKDPKALG